MSGRRIRHPGPEAEARHAAMPCRAQALALTLEPGRSINAAVAEALASHGFQAGYVLIEDVPMQRMDYVIPAASPDAAHAAWYSETHAPSAGGTILRAGLHLGRRDGEPFLHCHGLWDVPDKGLRMGHLLPFDAEVRQSVQVSALGLSHALLEVAEDEETNFRLFAPRKLETAGPVGQRRALLATIRPNRDICEAIEAICIEHGFDEADVLGIGSLVGADFEDGSQVTSYATEVLINEGRVVTGPNGPRARLDIAMVGMDGEIAQGVLVRGSNPVCVTFELLILG